MLGKLLQLTFFHKLKCSFIYNKRIYGENHHKDVPNMIKDIVIQSTMSDFKFGPKLHAIFPSGRLEEFIEVISNTISVRIFKHILFFIIRQGLFIQVKCWCLKLTQR